MRDIGLLNIMVSYTDVVLPSLLNAFKIVQFFIYF